MAQAQNRTEKTVIKTEVDISELKGIVKELAQAQNRTEKTVAKTEVDISELKAIVKDFGQAQDRTEQQVKELAQAQEKTEKTVRQLAKQVGGLSDVMGGDLEDIAYIVLHEVLEREFGWQVGALERVWQTWGREPEEVDIFGQATDPKEPNQTIWIVGEAKHNISIKEVDKFIKQLERARQHLSGEVFPIMFCYRARPEVQQMIFDADIRLVQDRARIQTTPPTANG